MRRLHAQAFIVIPPKPRVKKKKKNLPTFYSLKYSGYGYAEVMTMGDVYQVGRKWGAGW